MRSPRDSQRSKLYTAEHSLYHGRKFGSIEEVQGYVTRLTHSKWWTSREADYEYFRARRILVKDGRGRRSACGSYSGRYISLPAGWARSELVILHEIAHVITDPNKYAAHGREFAANFLDLVRHQMGVEVYVTLRNSFRTWGVRYKPKKKLTQEALAVLRERGRTLAAARREGAINPSKGE
jgi:putative metallohydrolase (TIGR04338 family)